MEVGTANSSTNQVQRTSKKYNYTFIIVFLLSIFLLFIFFIAILVFFLVGNDNPYHELDIINNCSQTLNLSLDNGNTTLPVNSKDTKKLLVSPGSNLKIQGYLNSDVKVNGISPFTKVYLNFAGQGYTRKTQISDGSSITPLSSSNNNSSDTYAISLQDGYNLPISIIGQSKTITCRGPIFEQDINEVFPNACPTGLQFPGTGNNYEACSSPCLAFGSQGTADYYQWIILEIITNELFNKDYYQWIILEII